MDPQSQGAPRPDEGRGASPESAPAPSGSYLPKPEFPAPKSRRTLGAAAAAGAVLALGLGYAAVSGIFTSPPNPAAPSGPVAAAQSREERVFFVSLGDRDAKATEIARAAIRREQSGTVATAAPGTPAAPSGKGEPSPSGDAPTPLSAARGQVTPQPEPAASSPERPRAGLESLTAPAAPPAAPLPDLAAAPSALRQAIADGSMSLFTFRFFDWADQDGDIVDLLVDGVPVGRVTISHAGAELTIPLKPGHTHRLEVVGIHDGGGGITFGAQSSVGEMRTRSMTPGETEVWTIGFK